MLNKFCRGLILATCACTSAAVLSASCVTSAINEGCIHYEMKTASNTDPYTNAPTAAQQQWFQAHMYRIMGYAGYWDSRLSWFPNSWFYRDSSSLYNGDTVPSQHWDWVLKDQSGNPVFIDWGCSNNWCPQYAPDYSNENFRQWWIQQVKSVIAKGYKGLFIDDVNFPMNLTDGWNATTPVDNNTGQPMTQAAWERYQADFLTEVRNAFPTIEICHNALWFAGNANPSSDPYVMQQIKAANYINIERGFADTGLTGDGGFWSIQNLFSYVDQVHGLGVNVLPQEYFLDDQFSTAAYLLINNGKDLFSNDEVTPANWPKVYDVNLGRANGARYNWNGLIRRDFANGMVLINPPGKPTVTVQLPASYVDINGTVVGSVTLKGREGALLTTYVNPGGPVPNGTYTMTNQASGMVLDDPGASAQSGTQMIQWAANGGSNQGWIFTSKGAGYYTIQNSSSRLYLGAGSGNGATLQQQSSTNSDSQLWSLKASGSGYMVINKAAGTAIDDPGSSQTQGTAIILWAQNGGSNQIWTIH